MATFRDERKFRIAAALPAANYRDSSSIRQTYLRGFIENLMQHSSFLISPPAEDIPSPILHTSSSYNKKWPSISYNSEGAANHQSPSPFNDFLVYTVKRHLNYFIVVAVVVIVGRCCQVVGMELAEQWPGQMKHMKSH